ncbi:MAG: DegQ family serine endoprotease [Oceanicaulis sp.]
MIRSLILAAAAGLSLMTPACAQERPEPARPATPAEPTPQAAPQGGRETPQSQTQVQLSFAPVVRQAAPAVVNVYSRRVINQRSPFAGDPFFERFFGPQVRQREVNSLGSGVIVDASGVIVTNNHVVEGAQDLRVVLSDRREYEAELLLADERTDLAILKINAGEDLPVLPYDDAGDAQVGDLVLAIGNPFGVGQTVTSGIVSALARTDVGITDYAFFIQTDAAVNPGNSGGALVDMDGELIGVNTAIFSRSGGSNGIGFAVPVEMVRTVVDAALADGAIVRPWLGARLQPVTADLAGSIGLDRPRGAIVSELWPGGAADEAGLERGDVLVAVDGVEVNNEAGVRFRFATRRIGQSAQVSLLRDGEPMELSVEARPAPGETEGRRLTVDGRNPLAGAELVQLSPAFNDENGIDPFTRGVVVIDVARRSAADYFGFQAGDLLVSLDDEPITSIEDAERVLEDAEGASRWPVEIERRGDRFSRVLSL